jgi:multiple RNA-binding domain-containing protein 1
MSFKKRRELEQKAASGKEDNWNSLFLRSDTVASAMAERLGVAKRELLDKETDNAAVRLAMAETHLIAETKAFFREHGVAVNAFEGSRKTARRSGEVLLVKNLPFDTSADDLRVL